MTSLCSWEEDAYDLIRQRNKTQSEPFVDIFVAYRYEEKRHRNLAEKHIEIRNQISIIQHDLQSYQKERSSDTQNNITELDEIKNLLANLQEDLSARSTKDFDDVKIRMDLERNLKNQKQLVSDIATEAALLKTELECRTEALATTTNELDHSKTVVDTVQKELESSRNLLAATEDRLREVESQNGRILTKLMDEKQKSVDLLNELTTLQNSKNSKAASIIGGGFSFMTKNIFGISHEDDDLGEKEDGEEEEFVEVGKDDEGGEEEARSSLFSEVTVPRTVLKTIRCHGCEINDVTFGSRKTFITGGADSKVKVFDLDRSTGSLACAEDEAVREARHAFTCGGPAISVHSAGDHVAAACGDGIARIWSVRTGKLRQSLSGHANKVTSVRLVGELVTAATTSTCTATLTHAHCYSPLLLLLMLMLMLLLLLLLLLMLLMLIYTM
jgi:conjugal transfer/entry exclusion protein